MKVFILVSGETKLDHQTKQSIHSITCEVGALSHIHKHRSFLRSSSWEVYYISYFSFRTNLYQV